ncbi:MAG: choice-of-anchor B family protein [Ardenticatenales bacterium]|nr:choice-of-anchor B family protein [Ardenticatenales bacterium]
MGTKIPFAVRLFSLGLLLALFVTVVGAQPAGEGDGPALANPGVGLADCVNGLAGVYPCQNVDLLAQPDLATTGGGIGKDIWGWTDPLDGAEYAIMTRSNGTSFFDLSDPTAPVYLGNMPSTIGSSTWRDAKVFENYAYIVADALVHGIQVFDLTRLRDVTSPPVTFTPDFLYEGIDNAHNIVINEDSGFAYAVGTDTCNGGLHMLDLSNPAEPVFAGCVSDDGYVHDAQCVNYQGDDPDYDGREICFNANEDTVTIVDVEDKGSPQQIARIGYPQSAYVHQGWLTDDHNYYIQDDESDELNFGVNTRTYVWDVRDLDNPAIIGLFEAETRSTDHNLYVNGNWVYQANNSAGLRILDLGLVATGQLVQTGYFDVFPSHDNAGFVGSWSVYPYFESGIVVVSSREFGLFVLQPHLQPVQPAVYLPLVQRP